MDEPKKSTPSAADIGSEAHTGIPKAGNVTPGTTPSAADLTENELEDVVGGFVGTETISAGALTPQTYSMKRGLGPATPLGSGGGH